MKKIFISVMLLFIIVNTVSAETRLDLGLNIPLLSGINIPGADESTNDYFSQSMNSILSTIPLVPEIAIHYSLELGPVHLGFGARWFTWIVVNAIWPNIKAEFELNNWVLSGEIGGGTFLLFGFIENFGFNPLILGDLCVAYKFTDWFRMGIGSFFIGEFSPDYSISDNGAIPYVIYIFGKFSFGF